MRGTYRPTDISEGMGGVYIDGPVDFSRTSNGSISNDSKVNVYGNFDSSGEKFAGSDAAAPKYFSGKDGGGDLKNLEKNKFQVSPDEVLQKFKSNEIASKYYYSTFLEIENEDKEKEILFENRMRDRSESDSDSEDEIDIVGTQC